MHANQRSDNQANLLAGVLDSSLDGIYAFRAERDESGQIVDFIFVVVNRAAEKMVGRTAGQLLGQRMLEMLPGNKTDGLFDAYVKVVETDTPFVTEHYYEHDGLAKWFSISATPYGDGFTVSFADITKRKTSEERFRVLFEHSTNAHLLFDDTGIIDCNQAAVDMLGYEDKQRFLKIHPAKLSPERQPDGRRSMEKCVEMDQAARDNGYHRFDWMHRRKDGSDILVEVTLNPVKLSGKDALLVVWHDLTERVETERAVRDAVDSLNEAQELANIGNWQWTVAEDNVFWSEQTKRMFGVPVDQPAPDFEAHLKQIHPDDRDQFLSVVERANHGHKPYSMRYRAVLPDGTIRLIEGHGQSEVGPDGEPVRMFGTVQDITDQEQAREEIRVAHDRYELLVAGNASGVWDWDCKTDAVYYSPRFNELIGYGPDGLESTLEAFVSHLHPDDRDRILGQVQRHIEQQGPYDVEYQLRHKDGHYVWCHAAGQAQWDDEGNPIRMAGSISDISNRKAAEREFEEQKHRLEFALKTSRTGLWDWDVKTGENFLSDTWYTMLGYEPGELPMHVKTWQEITHPEDMARAEKALADYFAGKTARYACETRVRNKAGDWQWVLDVGEAIERDDDGSVTRMIGLHLDIHAQKTAQQQLELARDQAQQASAAKSAFVANMSHEIRTPMNAILGYADLLLDGGQTEADKRNHAQTIRRSGKHLLGILNDVLDLSKIEAGKLAAEQLACDPAELFQGVLSLMAPKAIKRGIGLDYKANSTLPEQIKTDPTRVRQVLINLIGNAIKFTNAGQVTLAVGIEPGDDGTARLTCEVRDTGIGISDKQMAQLFKPFSQADDSTTRKFGGTGLGLAISTNLCKILGGELACTSTPGQGSIFTATFQVQAAGPATPPEPCPATVAPNPANVLQNTRILIVEDGPDNQRLFQHFVRKAGAETELAENGQVGKDAALKALQSDQPFDVILIDMQMPVLDGYDATRQLRDAGYDRPIIALTAHASSEDRDKCLAAGCTDYLSKPVDRHKLVETIAGHLDPATHLGVGI
jgi:PAS domain S-box-containing protein